MVCTKRLKVETWFLLVIFSLWLNIGSAQVGEVLVIEADEEYSLQQSNLDVDHLVIKGVFKIEDKNDITLKLSSLIIDGGSFIVGSKHHPFQHRLTIALDSNSSSIQVRNGGNLHLFGQAVPKMGLEKVSSDKNVESKEYQRTIELTTQNGGSGYVAFHKAGAIHVSRVSFNGLGTDTHPALFIQDQGSERVWLSGCVFRASKNIDLSLEKSNITAQGNWFLSKGHTSIRSSQPNTIHRTVFQNNSIHNSGSSNSFAVVLEGAEHTFTENDVFVNGKANGVGIFNKPSTITTKEQGLKLNNNRITNLGLDIPKTNVGLQVDNFKSKALIRSSGNNIRGFGIGAIFKSPKFVASNFVFTNNIIGCIPGPSFLQRSRFSYEDPNPAYTTKAIWVTDRHSVSAPKLSAIKIYNYNTGVHFEGLVSPSNYFAKLSFEQTTPLSFLDLNIASIVHDKDGCLLQKKEKVPAMKMHGHHAHHMEPKKRKVSSGFILFPENSFFSNATSKALPGHENMRFSPRSSTGTLTIATGMGLTDPVHEHQGQFNGVTLINTVGSTTHLKKKSNKYEVDVSANEFYELNFGTSSPPFYDFGFEWEAPSQKSVFLKIPYVHDKPVALRSFGNQLYSVPDMEALKNSKVSTFYWDKAQKVVFLKMVAQANFEEMVIYSSEVLTEISNGGTRVPLSIKTDTSLNKICFEYTLTNKNSFSKLEVLDYYGNVVDKPFEGYSQRLTNKAFINLTDYDFKNNVYRYALTVDNEVHRGPVYIY